MVSKSPSLSSGMPFSTLWILHNQTGKGEDSDHIPNNEVTVYIRSHLSDLCVCQESSMSKICSSKSR